MTIAGGLIGLILFALKLVALAGAAFAIFHAARQRKDAFTAVDKLSKPIWLGILVAALLVVFLFGPVNMLGLIGVVAICVYLVDVRPRVDDIQRGPRW
ncbi:DUF2516 family protein [Rhodococcus sp. TAF43]|uniref:DUF2516 family protein n=1 Tax=unclassified Rhodococcus (in: high G+C Gram-positive bacteria) TaxID=192944 RepID=UPI000E0CBF3D|nr:MULTISPECIES: DUF2516 family protein [unclassified Rhodococcus (in: high G+C Gram-positive bacteria)]QKT12982.1 DUF2516 family protein [Rhodococcus sp. W8901]RDI33735.1 uncharacterized protein DUF2516 [Rhodococcus sp. AG1013]